MHQQVAHPNFYLMFDTSHAYMCAVVGARQHGAKEDAAGRRARVSEKLEGRIGAIHLIDSDGTLHGDETSTHRPFRRGLHRFPSARAAIAGRAEHRVVVHRHVLLGGLVGTGGVRALSSCADCSARRKPPDRPRPHNQYRLIYILISIYATGGFPPPEIQLVPRSSLPRDRDQHGYGIMQEVLERTGGKVRLWPATLYGTLKRLIDADLLEESDTRPAPEFDDARRRYYRLTRFGRRVLAAESERLEDLVRIIHAKRGFTERKA